MRCHYRKLIGLLGAVAMVGSATHARAPDAIAAAVSTFQPRRISSADLKPRREWRNIGRSTPEACFETLCWAQATGELDVVANSIVLEDGALAKAQEAFAQRSPDEQRQLRSADRFVAKLLTLRTPLAAVRLLGVEPNPNRPDEVMLHWVNAYDDGRIRENKNIVLRSTADGWRQKITVRLVEPMLKLSTNRKPGPVTGQSVVPPTNPVGVSAPLVPGLIATQNLRDRGNATAVAAFETIQWAKARRDFIMLERLVVVRPEARARAEAQLASLAPESRARMPDITTPERLVLADWIASNDDIGLLLQAETVLADDRIYFTGVRQNGRGVSNFDYVLRRTERGWQWFMADRTFTVAATMSAR